MCKLTLQIEGTENMKFNMTSPAITKSPDNQKKKSPAHSAAGTERTPSHKNGMERTPSHKNGTAPGQQPETFSWLRIFRLADLMMKQGC